MSSSSHGQEKSGWIKPKGKNENGTFLSGIYELSINFDAFFGFSNFICNNAITARMACLESTFFFPFYIIAKK